MFYLNLTLLNRHAERLITKQQKELKKKRTRRKKPTSNDEDDEEKKNTVTFWNGENVTVNNIHTFVSTNLSNLKATNQHQFLVFFFSPQASSRAFFSSLTQFIRPYKKCKYLFK